MTPRGRASTKRIIERLRDQLPGTWTYVDDSQDVDGIGRHWRRAEDDLRVYARSHTSISEGGVERYFTRWHERVGPAGEDKPLRFEVFLPT